MAPRIVPLFCCCLLLAGGCNSLANQGDHGDDASGGADAEDDEGAGGDAGSGGATGEEPGGSGAATAMSCAQEPLPCGGDPVGKWQIQKSCLLDLLGTLSCAGVRGDGSQVLQSGTMSFNADNTFSSLTAVSGQLKITYPGECTAGLDCKALAATFSATLPSGYRTEQCVAAGTGCACTFTVEMSGIVDAGIYSTSGDVLTMTSGSGVSAQVDYCARGNSMSLLSRNPSTGTTAQISWLVK